MKGITLIYLLIHIDWMLFEDGLYILMLSGLILAIKQYK